MNKLIPDKGDKEGCAVAYDDQCGINDNGIFKSINEITKEITAKISMYEPHDHGLFSHGR